MSVYVYQEKDRLIQSWDKLILKKYMGEKSIAQHQRDTLQLQSWQCLFWIQIIQDNDPSYVVSHTVNTVWACLAQFNM